MITPTSTMIFATNLKQRSNTISTFVKKIPSAHHALTKPLPNLKKKSTSPIQQQVDKKSSKQLSSNQACIIPTPQFFIWNYLFNVAQNCITLWSPCRKKKKRNEIHSKKLSKVSKIPRGEDIRRPPPFLWNDSTGSLHDEITEAWRRRTKGGTRARPPAVLPISRGAPETRCRRSARRTPLNYRTPVI